MDYFNGARSTRIALPQLDVMLLGVTDQHLQSLQIQDAVHTRRMRGNPTLLAAKTAS
jgi:hypothetical protein